MASPGPITHADVQHWIECWNSHDIKQVASLFASDAIVYQPQNPEPLTGEDITRFFQMVFSAYPDVSFELQYAIVEGNQAASFERVRGTWLESFTDPATGRKLEPNGRAFDHLGVMLLTYNSDHLLTSARVIWDRMTVEAQLGLLNTARPS